MADPRLPPQSLEAEQSVLGAMLLDKDAVVQVADFLAPEHFYKAAHGQIFEVCLKLYEERQPIDLVTVTEELKSRKQLKAVGGSAYLTELVGAVPTAAHVEEYGRIVKAHYIRRELIRVGSELADLGFDAATQTDRLMDLAEQKIFNVSQRHLRQAFIPIKEALAESFDRLDELHKSASGLRGVPTGFTEIDNALAGMQASNLLILAARPGVGKCVAGDTLIVDPDTGRRQTIESIVSQKEGKISTLTENLKFKKAKPSVFVDDGEKRVFEIKTQLGNKLEATAVHPLLTIDGWRKVEELNKGVRIAVPRKVDSFGRKNWEDWKVKSLAYFLGDGGLTKASPKFTNGNPVILSDFCNSVVKFDGVETSYVKQSKLRLRTPTVVVVNKDPYKKGLRKIFAKRIRAWLAKMNWSQRKLALGLNVSPSLVGLWVSGNSLPGLLTYPRLEELMGERIEEKVDRKNLVAEWLSNLGVMGKLAIEKEIPPEVFELNKDNLSLFLNRLYACEGSVVLGKIRGSGRISFASSSYRLAEGVKHLLLRFGILVRLRNKKVRYREGQKDAYELEIMGARNILTFVKEIGIFGKKKVIEKIKRLAESKESSKNFSKDTLPLEVWKLIIEDKGKLSWRELYRRMGHPLSHNIHVNKRQLRRETLREIALAINSKRLLDLAESDIYWDRIVSIRPAGVKRVYDLTVNRTHNFVANDIVVHNTSLALNIAAYVAVEAKLPVGFFSLEMSREELLDRLLVAQADIDAWRLKTGKLDEDDFTKLSDAMGVLAEAQLFVDDTPGVSVLEMRTKARRLMAEKGLKLLVVDYLQLVRGRGLENRVQEVTEISQGLKNLARELKVPVLALSQLSRAVEQRGSKQPQLADLRESGCLLGDSLLTLADTGDRVTIESLAGKRNIKILAMDQQMKLVPAAVSRVFSSGKKMVYTMRLKSGKVIGATANHKFFTIGGWKRLDQLQVGDRLATPRIINVGASEVLSDDRLIVLAHMIGDGCYVKRQPLHYTNSDLALVHAVETAAVHEFAVRPRIVPQQNWYHLYLASEEQLARGRRNPIVKWFDEDLGIYGQHSRQKLIPEVVFRQPQEKLALFLKHLWATDGSVHINKKTTGPLVRIYYASGSELLARQVSHLLLRLGIISRLGYTGKVRYEDVWAVHVQGKTDQLRFLELVGGVGDKAKLVKQARDRLQKIEANPNNDVIPKDIWEDIEILRREVGLTTREFHAQLGWAYSGTERHKHGLSRKRLKRVLQVVSNDKLRALVSSDLYWDEVVKITRLGVREVFDATVPKYANFVANDIVVHNSIEQDADVVMFLYREDEDNLENIKLWIAKHRNGPTKLMDLYFRGDRIKFYGVDKKRE